jgi:hypothetical protein
VREEIEESQSGSLFCFPVFQGASEQVDVLKGTGFSPYIKPPKSTRALAPEGMLDAASATLIL